jgi:hypothetical protein
MQLCFSFPNVHLSSKLHFFLFQAFNESLVWTQGNNYTIHLI